MKTNNTTVVLFIGILLLSLTSCSTNQNKKTIEGKYVSIYDAEDYLIFKKDHTFQNSLWKTTSANVTKISDHFIYSIDENNIITVIDTTEYEGQDKLNKDEIGIIYKEYICLKWNGILLNKFEDTKLTRIVGNLNLIYNLKEDKTYEYTVTSDGEVVHTENGTYSINNNEVICTNDEGEIITFINIDGNAYCIEYVKE